MDAGGWRTFNLAFADRTARSSFAASAMVIRVSCLAPGLHMVTAHDPDDPDTCVARHLARFRRRGSPGRLA